MRAFALAQHSVAQQAWGLRFTLRVSGKGGDVRFEIVQWVDVRWMYQDAGEERRNVRDVTVDPLYWIGRESWIPHVQSQLIPFHGDARGVWICTCACVLLWD